RERRGAARLREARGGLGVGDGGEEEDRAGDEEGDRRQAQRVRRHQPQRVVDRRADVAVRRREQRRRAEDAVESPGMAALYWHGCLYLAGRRPRGPVGADATWSAEG